MKMPNDDFLEPLRKRPNNIPKKEFEISLHDKIFEEVTRRRSMTSWKFRLGIVAVLLLLIIINPLELIILNTNENETSISKQTPSTDTSDELVPEQEKVDFTNYPTLTKIQETLLKLDVPQESVNVFLNYHYGLLNNDPSLLKRFGFFSDYEKNEMIDKIFDYYKQNVNLSTLSITNVERSLGEPEYFVSAQYENLTGNLLEITYILASNGQLVYDPIKNLHEYFLQKKIIETNGVTIEIPYFQGELRGIGESNSLAELNDLVEKKAISSSYDSSLGFSGDVTSKIIYEISSVLSIEFRIEWNSEEMAHPYTASTFLTYDLTKGRVMELDDFVLEEELPKLEEKVKDLLKEDKMFSSFEKNVNSLTITKDHSFYLSTMDRGIVLYYPRYTLSSMAEVRIHPTLGIVN